jgi:uncharacterized protein (TIGR02145 family)
MKKGSYLLTLVCLVPLIFMVSGCKKATVPEISTVEVTQITLNSAVSGGTITSDGGEDITEKGICWSTTASPTIADSKTSDGKGSANFASNMVGLVEGTSYYVRAYATNSVGTAYGNELTFTTNQVTGAVLSTTEAINLTSTTATAGGNITDAGGGAISARGVCWSTTQNPTTANNKTVNGTGDGVFTSTLTGLTDGTTYYYRAYATNSTGTTYGEQYSFITPVTDIEGNLYKTVVIGTQIWMAENLKTTKYNDDTSIPEVTDNTEWVAATAGAYCWYNNDADYYKPIYGGLYNWFAAKTGKLCPTGWHVPTDAEFNTLELFLGLNPDSVDVWGWRGTDHGKQMKNSTGWSADQNGTNTSGFAALPGGYRNNTSGAFNGLDIIGYWWSSSDDATNGKPEVGWYRRLEGIYNDVYKASTLKPAGKSIRCIKD